MSLTLSQILSNRDQYEIIWGHRAHGMLASGIVCACNERRSVSVDEAIRMMRYTKVRQITGRIDKETDLELLREFLSHCEAWEIKPTLRHLLNGHRDKAMVSCDEHCFCWDVERFVS